MVEKLLIYTEKADGSRVQFPASGVQASINSYTFSEGRMGSVNISCSLMYERCLDDEWTRREFVEFRGEKYWIFDTPTSSKSNTDLRYKHELTFKSERTKLDNTYFFDVVSPDAADVDQFVSNSTNFTFFGDIHEFAKRLNYSLEYSQVGYSVVVDDGISSEAKLMSFQDKYFSEVLQEVFNVYELPYYFVGTVIHIGFTSNAITKPFKYGHDRELLTITKTNANYKIVNRCTGIGSTENIPPYYPNDTQKGTVLAIAGDTNKGVMQSNLTVDNQVLYQEKVKLNSKVEYKETNKRVDLTVYLKKVQYPGRGDTSNTPSISFYEYNKEISTGRGDQSIDDVIKYLPEIYMQKVANGSNLDSYKIHARVYLKLDLEEDTDFRLDFNCFFKFAIYKVNRGSSADRNEPNRFETRELVWGVHELRSVSWEAQEVVSGIDSVNENLSSILLTNYGGNSIIRLTKGHHDILIRIESSVVRIHHDYIPTRQNNYSWQSDFVVNQPVISYRGYNTWFYNEKRINLSDIGISISNVTPQVGDFFTQQQERSSYLITSPNLMPPIYRESAGEERFYNALNNTYISPETNEYYDFENPYVDGNPKEQIVSFDYIKPSIKGIKNAEGIPIGQILDVAFDEGDNDELNEEENKYEHEYFYIKLNRFDGAYAFNLFEQGIATGEMTIAMTSGNCAACQFKISVLEQTTNNVQTFKNPVQVDSSGNIVSGGQNDKWVESNIQPQQQDTINNQVWLRVSKDDSTFGTIMPSYNRNYMPKVGDTFVLVNISLPKSYILSAENELKEAIIKYMASNNSEKFNFSINFKRIFFAEYPEMLSQIDANARLQIAYNENEDGTDKLYELYVSNYTYRVKDNEILPEITVELSDTITIKKGNVQKSIDAVKQDIMSSIGSIDFLKMGLKYFIRKDTDDSAEGHIVFNNGIYVTSPIKNPIQEGGEINMLMEGETNAIQEGYIESRSVITDGCLVYTTSLPLKGIIEKQTLMIDNDQATEIQNVISHIESGYVILPTASDVTLNEGGIKGTVKLNAPITFTLNTNNNSLSISVPVAFEGEIFMVNMSAKSVVMGSLWEYKVVRVGGGSGSIVIQDTPPEDKTALWIDTSNTQVGTVTSSELAPLVEAIQSMQQYLNTIVKQRDLIINPGDVTNTVASSVLKEYTPIDPNPNATPEEKITLLASAIGQELVPNAADYEPNTKAVRAHYGTMKEIQDNFKHFVDYELILATDRKALYTKINGEPVNLTGSGGGGGGGGSLDYEALDRLDSIGFVAPSGQTYRVKVNNNGQLIVYKKELDVSQAEPTGGQTDPTTGWVYVTTLFLEKLYINSLYCGGLTSNEYSYNPCSHNFVELSNLTNNDISLNGLSLQYGTEGGNWEVLPLWGEIKKGSTFLIRGAQCSVMDINTTRIKVKTFDMEWYASDGNLIRFDNRKAKFFLTWGTEPSSVINPYNGATSPIRISKGYIDLVGLQVINAGDADKVDAFEKAPYGYLNSKYIFTKYYQMDNVKQATKALSARNNASWMYFVDLTQDIVPRVESYTPRASFENKNIFFNKTLLDPNKANKVTMTLGRKGTAPNATRCFNWVSVGYYNEYIQWQKVGDTTSMGLLESYKKETGIRKYYNRIRAITTDGTPFTTHKIILRNLSAGDYEFKILRERPDVLQMQVISDTYTFTVVDGTSDEGKFPMFIQTSDQQGFNWDEYQMWKIAAKEIRSMNDGYINTGRCTFMINTGDMTQNGNRINEWLDYDEGRTDLNVLAEMVTVGNNDLTPANVYVLGDGGDNSKINPTNISFFYCYEMDEENPPIFTIEGKEVFVECLYSFDYGSCHFLCVNSEISANTERDVYGLKTQSVVYDYIKEWCERDAKKSISAAIKIAYCHEMPFTIITQDLINSFYWDGIEYPAVERSGSRLNFNVSKANAYWFSKFLQTHGYRACLGGHKHTYTCSYPILENPASSMKPIIQVNQALLNENFGSDALYEETTGLLKGQKFPERWRNDSNYDMVKHLCTFELVDKITAPTYIMSQATGYKHTSNKELPSPNTPWLRYFFPASITIKSRTDITAKVNAGQRYPFYIIYNVTQQSSVRWTLSAKVQKVSGAFDNAGKYNVNIQGTDPNVLSIGGNGEQNNGDDIIRIEYS